MADYSVILTLTIGITASTEEVAAARGSLLEEAAYKGIQAIKAQWLGDIDDSQVEVEEA